jgi:hypothetical protein
MRRVGILLICVLVIPIVAGADLTIKEKTSTRGFMGMWTAQGEETTYLKGDKIRTESREDRQGMMPSTKPIKDAPPNVAIIRLDKGVVWHVNLYDKTYMEVSLEPEKTEKPEDYQLTVKDVKVTKTGQTKEIMGHKCDGVEAEVTFETSVGDQAMSQVMDLLFWMSPKTEGLEDMRHFWDQMLEMTQGMEHSLPMGEAMTKMWEKLGDIKGVPLGMEMTMGGAGAMGDEEMAQMKESVKAMQEYLKSTGGDEEGLSEETGDTSMRMVREVVSISDAKLDDSLFEIPEGFKKTSTIRTW